MSDLQLKMEKWDWQPHSSLMWVDPWKGWLQKLCPSPAKQQTGATEETSSDFPPATEEQGLPGGCRAPGPGAHGPLVRSCFCSLP